MAAPASTLVFETSVLAAALRDVTGAIEKRNTIMICANVLIDAGDDGSVRLTGTNLDIVATRKLRAVSVSGACRFTLRADRLADVLGTFDSGSQVCIEVSDDAAIVRSGRARLRFATLPAKDFPEMVQRDVVASFAMDAKALLRGISAVRHAISTEGVRYYLNGIFWHVRGGRMLFVATDGHRLARFADALPEGASAMPDVILRTACVELVAKAAAGDTGEIVATFGDNKVNFSAGDLTILAKVVDGVYPDYARVIPSEFKAHAIVDRDEFDAALARVIAATSSQSRSGKLTFNSGALQLETHSAEHGSATDELACEFDGGRFEIGFNLRYVRDALAALPVDTVRMSFVDPTTPTLLTSVTETGATLALMPMRV